MGNRVTIKDVAREANVSIKTVSNVLNDTGSMRPDTRRIQFVSATLVFGLAAFDCSLAISSSHTSLGVL